MLATLRRLLASNIRPGSLARLILAVNILLIILVAYSLAQLSWRFLPLGSATSPSNQKIVAQPPLLASASSKPLDYAVIADWHLFGQASEVKPVDAAPVAQAPETKLNLKLVGVFFTTDGQRALALIAEGGGEELSYTIGEQLPQSKARLEKILRNRVMLWRNGRLEALSLPTETEGGDNTPLMELQQEELPVNDDEPTPEPEPEQIDESAITPEAIDASAIASRFRDKALTQPEQLQDLAVATPYVQNGEFMGFRLRPGRDRELLAQLGLRAGDVVTSVNGTRLDDPIKGAGLLQQLVNANQINIQVLRNGAEIPLTFILNEQ